jgi:cation transport ATPase
VQQVTDQGLHLQHAGRSLGVVALDIAVERFGVKPAAIPGDLVAEGCVVLCVLVDGDYAGLVRLENKPVEGAAQAIETLSNQGIEQMHMITHEADDRVHPQLRELGFSSCQTSLDEVAKLRFIHQLIDQGRRVALVSDGLFQASGDCLNICLSNMPESRQLEADVWLIQPELRGIATALNLARHSSRSMRRNQRLNLAANGAVLLAGSFDLLSPTLAAILSNSVTLGMIREALHTREENTQ